MASRPKYVGKYRVRPGSRFWGVEEVESLDGSPKLQHRVYGPGEVVQLTEGQVKNGLANNMDAVIEGESGTETEPEPAE
jgi:hypothetical protein